MLNAGILVWNHSLIEAFLGELEAYPHSFARVVIISPFINLAASSRIARRVRGLVANLLRRDTIVLIVSDLTRTRVSSFATYLMSQPRFPGFLGLYPKLHSKCGYALSKTGAHIAFVGSANLTDAALYRNKELVIGVKIFPSVPQTYTLFNQIKQQADEIVAKAVGPAHLSARKLIQLGF